MVRRWVSTVSVAAVCSAVGDLTRFLPWAEATVATFDPTKTPRPDGAIQAREIHTESYPGYQFWHAQLAAGGFLGVLLFLVATGGLAPPPRWRSVTLLAAGGIILGSVVAGLNTRPAWAASDMAAGRLVGLSWGAANFVVIGLAVVVMLSAAVELRGRLAATWFIR